MSCKLRRKDDMPRITAVELVREYIEAVWNRGDLSSFERLTAPEFKYTLAGQPPRSRAEMARFLAMTRQAFPDWLVEIVDVVADDRSVAVRWEGVVTHSGPFYGIPPTGKRVKVSGINLYRASGDRIEAEWEQMDSLGMLTQLGVTGPARTS